MKPIRCFQLLVVVFFSCIDSFAQESQNIHLFKDLELQNSYSFDESSRTIAVDIPTENPNEKKEYIIRLQHPDAKVEVRYSYDKWSSPPTYFSPYARIRNSGKAIEIVESFRCHGTNQILKDSVSTIYETFVDIELDSESKDEAFKDFTKLILFFHSVTTPSDHRQVFHEEEDFFNYLKYYKYHLPDDVQYSGNQLKIERIWRNGKISAYVGGSRIVGDAKIYILNGSRAVVVGTYSCCSPNEPSYVLFDIDKDETWFRDDRYQRYVEQ